jgi:hypothetical protein
LILFSYKNCIDSLLRKTRKIHETLIAFSVLSEKSRTGYFYQCSRFLKHFWEVRD